MATSKIVCKAKILSRESSNGGAMALVAADFFGVPSTNKNYYLLSIVDAAGNQGLWTLKFQSGGTWVITPIVMVGFTGLVANAQGTVTPVGGTAPYYMTFILLASIPA